MSGCGGISWLLQEIIKPLVVHVPAHLENTAQLLDEYQKADARKELTGNIPVSLDVVSLYTNVSVPEAVATVSSYIDEYDPDLHGFSREDITELLDIILNNNVFHFNLDIYKQIKGLAMGGRVSGTLAILAMDKFEKATIRPLLSERALYRRYIDDINMIVPSKQRAQEILEISNRAHPDLKFDPR